jgi:LysM repeat protein
MTIFRFEVPLSVLVLGTAAGSLSAAVAQPAASKAETYTVKPGDTLFSIARKLYGDESMWAQIYRLNTGSIADPKWIRPGQVLTLVASDKVRAVPAQDTPAPDKPAAEPAASSPAPEIIKPTPQPERKPVVIETDAEPSGDTLFARRRTLDAAAALKTYREQPYRPLRRGEFFAAGFLTEGEKFPFGKLLGAVTPQQIRAVTERTMATLYTEVALLPPEGAQYQVNDSLLIVAVYEAPSGYGDIVLPTGMVRVTGQSGKQTLGTVVSVFAAIRSGQAVLPIEKFVPGSAARAQPVADGVTGVVITQREPRELKHPHNFLFLSVGKKDGVSRGDLFEVRRDPAKRTDAADTIDEPMALLQVVHVRDKTATAKIINVISPDIAPGTRVKQVAKLPS